MYDLFFKVTNASSEFHCHCCSLISFIPIDNKCFQLLYASKLSMKFSDIWNEMNQALGHLCAHRGYTGPGEPLEDGEMNEMTLSSRHRIWNSSHVGLRPSTLPLGHRGSPQYWVLHVDWEETFLFLSNCSANHYPRAPALEDIWPWRSSQRHESQRMNFSFIAIYGSVLFPSTSNLDQWCINDHLEL